MKKQIFYLYIFLLLILLFGLGTWLWQNNKLSFQQVHPFSAIGPSQPILISLPETVSETTSYPWQETLLRRNQLLDSLTLQQGIKWKNWWLLPTRGEAGEATYVMIGEAVSGLAANWRPNKYGPALPFGGGHIYTFSYTQDDQFFFSRYRNLLLIGRYPFQLEAALRRLSTGKDNWKGIPAFQTIASQINSEVAEAALWLYPKALSVDLPTNWLSPVAIRQWQQLEAVRFAFSDVRDSSASLQWQAVTSQKLPHLDVLPWTAIPPEVTTITPVPSTEQGGLGSVWSMHLPMGEIDATTPAPNLWLATRLDSIDWTSRRASAELIDYEEYQTYRLERWRDFGLLGQWSKRRGALQPWVLTLDDWIVVSLELEVLERWLDLHLLGASILSNTELAPLIATKQDAVGLLSWSATEEMPALLAQLFPETEWAAKGISVLELVESDGELLKGKGRISVDMRKPQGIQLHWTVPLPRDIDVVLPILYAENSEVMGLLIGQQGITAQVYTTEGVQAQLTLPKGKPMGPVYQVTYEETRYILTTDQGVFQLSEKTAPISLPGTIGVEAATAVQLQTRGNSWEWLLLNRDGRLQFGQSTGELGYNWEFPELKDSLTEINVLWQRDSTEEQVIIGPVDTTWFSYSKRGELLWSAPYPNTMAAGLASGLSNQNDPRLYLPLVDGKVQVLNRAGEYFNLSAGRGPVDHALVGQWWGDGRSDIILQRGSLVHLFGYVGNEFKERWQYRLPVVPDTLISTPNLGVLAVHSATQQLWLLDGNGQLQSGFPITGSPQAYVVYDAQEKGVLLVIADDELYAYGIN